LIVMPAGQATEYKLRYHEEGTPENIAARTKMVTDIALDRQIEGVVIYCLDKNEGSASFEAVRKVFDSARKLSR
jgi:ribosomal protein S24E